MQVVYTNKDDEILQGAINKYGAVNQKIVAIEEFAEVQKTITKDIRNKGNLYDIAEEMADAYIMLEQLLMIYKNEDKVNMFITHKMERLERLINE